MTSNLSTDAVEGRFGTSALDDLPEFLTTQEVADLLRTPAESVRYWAHVGKGVPSFKVGRRRLYARGDVLAFIAEARGVSA